MHPILFAALSGEQDAQFAALKVTPEVRKMIRAARTAVRKFSAKHGGDIALRINGNTDIHFFRDLPEAFLLQVDPVVVNALPRLVDNLDFDAYIKESEAEDVYCRSEMTGLQVRDTMLNITGYEKHGDDWLVSHTVYLDGGLSAIEAAVANLFESP